MMLLIGERYRSKTLTIRAFETLKRSLAEVARTQAFSWLSLRHLENLIDQNEISREIDLLESILLWVLSKLEKIDEKELRAVRHLLSKIRPELISINDFKSSNLINQNSQLIRPIEQRIKEYNANIYCQPLLQHEKSSVRATQAFYCQVDGVQCSTPIKVRPECLVKNAM